MIEQEAKVVFNKKVASDTILMGLKAVKMVAEARPGQFVMLRAGTARDPLLRRPFSICGVKGGDLLLILYRVVGRGTIIMSRCGEGERLSVLGPLGKGFVLPADGTKSILVSGGVGIAPLLFLTQSMRNGKLTFMAGYSTRSEVVDVRGLGLSNAQVILATDDGTAGHQGPVTDLLEAHLDGPSRDPVVLFACGPTAMLKRVADMARQHTFPCQLSLEARMACGIGACRGCAVEASPNQVHPYYHVCRDGPVFSPQALNFEKL